MNPSRQPESQPLWKEEFSIEAAQEQLVNRRQFTKFLTLTSLGMFAGNLWILVKTWLHRKPVLPERVVARATDIPVGGVKLFRYPGEHDPCILVRTAADSFVAYSQKCTHLSCPVFYSAAARRLECPCHEGAFAVETGDVLKGPPPRPLPRVVLEERDGALVAVGMEEARHE